MDYKDIILIKQMIANGVISQEIAEKYIPELKESKDDRIRKYLIDVVNDYCKGSEHDGCIAWLEKQGEQKPADKVEPKFKEGDWIVDNCGYIWKIEEILNQFYLLEGIEGGESRPTIEWVNKTFHLWTIQDAKAGDVLATKDAVFIFKHIDKTGLSLCKTYCEVIGNSELGLGFDFPINSVSLATKEQRDLLFQKMYDAGYEWDAEKKELKNIEYEIEIPFGAKDSELQEVTYYIPKGFHAEIDDNEVVIKKGEKPTKWSKEDEQYLLVCKNALAKYQTTDKWDACIISQWLDNHLRPQNTWKPSDEQINALEYYIYSTSPTATITKGTIYGNLMVELLEQLKKLREE